MKNTLVLFLSIITTFTFAQTQWASKVIEYSSQYTSAKYSATQVLGQPSVIKGGESKMAWSPKTMDSKYEFIKVGFDKPIKAKQITIYENYKPGAISAVYAYNTSGKEFLIQKFKPQKMPRLKRILKVQITGVEGEIVAVKIELNCKKVDGYNQIDAIALSGSLGEVKIEVDIADDIVFEGDAENLGENVNTDKYADQNPVISPDGKTLFFVRRNHPMNTGGVDDENEIWVSELGEKGDWQVAYNIGRPLNNTGNNFVCSTSPDGKSILIGNTYNKDGTMSKGVSTSLKSTNRWQFPTKQNMASYYNNNKYVNFYQSTSRKYLLSSVERNDTKGEKDIYVSFLLSHNSWSEPINLGAEINTAANDFAPFLAPDDKTLYFSSYGHVGFGSADIFVSKRLDDSWTKWSKPKNLGKKINSKGGDAGYTIAAKGDYAYFNSSKNGSSDIYRIKLPQELQPDPVVLIKGKVYDKKTNQPIGSTVIYENLKNGKEAGIAQSDSKTGEYTIVLPYGIDYGFRASAKGYIAISEHLNLSAVKEYKEIERDLSLIPIEVGQVVRLNNIFFEFGKSTLKEESFPELNRVVKLMTENGNMSLEISGHTDDVGSNVANLKLSQDRAQSVVNYLTAKNINQNRLVAKGYGENAPVAKNNTEEGKMLNRRVEFRILKK